MKRNDLWLNVGYCVKEQKYNMTSYTKTEVDVASLLYEDCLFDQDAVE